MKGQLFHWQTRVVMMPTFDITGGTEGFSLWRPTMPPGDDKVCIMMILYLQCPKTAHIDVLVQERCNSITNPLELHLPCTNPFIYRVTSAHTMYSWWNRFLSSRRTRFVNPHYNMVGVAVVMVISTMHEKSCIDSHIARKFEKKFQNSVIHTSRNHNDESAEVSQSWIS